MLDEEEYEGGGGEGQEADSQEAMSPGDGLDDLIEHDPSLANLHRLDEVRLGEQEQEVKQEEEKKKEVKESLETERTVDNEFDMKVLKNKTASTKQEDKMDVEKRNVRLDGVVKVWVCRVGCAQH